MAVTLLTGVQDDNTILSNRRKVDMDDKIAMLDPEQSQFTTILQKLSSKPAISSKVEWLEDQLLPRTTTLSASVTSGAATFAVATGTGKYFKANDLCRIVSTGEAVAVSAAPATDTVGIARAIGSTAAASAASGVDVVIIGNAALQGGSLPTRIVTKKTNAYNYTQIFRKSYGFTNTLAASTLLGGNEPGLERVKKAVEHKRDIEASVFFGARNQLTSGANPQGFSGGALEFISTNINNPNGAMSKSALDGYLSTVFSHGSATAKVLFAAPLVAKIISTYSSVGLGSAWGTGDVEGASARFGVKVASFISGAYGWNVPVVVKREWNDFSQSAGSGYGSWAFIIDFSNVSLRPLRSTQFLTGRQANDADGIDEEYLTELSLEFQQESTHAIIKNATS